MNLAVAPATGLLPVKRVSNVCLCAVGADEPLPTDLLVLPMNLPSSGIEQRVHLRKALRVNAELIAPGAPVFPVRTMDISAGGIGVIASLNPPSGLHVIVRMRIPARAGAPLPVEVAAQVTHSVFMTTENGFKVGLRFVEPAPAVSAAVAQFLKG